MATIADYRVVMDDTATLRRGGPGVNFVRKDFSLPAHIAAAQAGILMFRIDAEDVDEMRYELKINGTKVLTLVHTEERFGTIHEVIGGNVLRFGDNNQFEAVITDGEGVLKISDVVVYFQATV